MLNQRTRFHALVDLKLIKKSGDYLSEGDTKTAHLFKVNHVVGDYWTSTHCYKIEFFQTTFSGDADDFLSEKEIFC